MLHPYLFHGTTEEYVQKRSKDGRPFLSYDRYTSKSLVALGFAKTYARRFNSRMAIITLKNVKLNKPIPEEDEDPLSLSSFGVDLPVDQTEIENHETDQIDGIHIYNQNEMERFIRRFIKQRSLELDVEELIQYYN